MVTQHTKRVKGNPSVNKTKRIAGVITETSAKRVVGDIAELSTKRVLVDGGSGIGQNLNVWGQTWGDVFGNTWGGVPTPPTGIHPTVDVTKRIEGVILETSTKRVPAVSPSEFV